MAVRYISLLMAAGVGVIVLGVIVAIALLISSERGRTILKVLLIVPALALVVALLTLFSWRAGSFARHQAEARRLARQQAHVQRAEVRKAMAEASAHFDRAIARLDEPDPEVQKALAEASGRLRRTQRQLDEPGAEVDRAMADLQARIQEQLSRIDHPTRNVREAFAKASARIEQMRAKLEQMQPGRPVAHADLKDNSPEPESTDAVAVADKDETESAEPPEKTEESVEEPAPPTEAPAEKIAEDRPEWVDATARKLGSVYQMKVDVGPYADQEELDRELPKALQKGIDEYVTTYLGPRARGKIRLPLDYVRSEVVEAEWKETVQVQITPEGQIPAEYVPTTRLYVLLQFDYPVNARIEEEWDKVVVTERLYGVGSLAGMVLMLLAGVYAYLRIDLATGGAYRGRLRLAAAAVLLIAILAGLALSAA
jgi:prefoldin subunit 5